MNTRLLLTTIVTFFSVNLLHAQFITGFGIKGGLTISDFSKQYATQFPETTNFRRGFNISMYGELFDNEHLSFISEAGYDQRGYTEVLMKTDEFGNYIGNYYFYYRTNYVFAAMGTKLKFKRTNLTPYLIILPRIDFFTGYKVTVSEDLQGWPEDYEDYILENIKKVNFGINFGAGLEVNNLLPFGIFFEASYSPNMITSLSDAWVTVKEHFFNFKLGVNFIKQKKDRKR